MSILKTIRCDVNGCANEYTETSENGGFPGWGHVQGVMKKLPNGLINDRAHICPECMKNKIIPTLNEGENNDDLG